MNPKFRRIAVFVGAAALAGGAGVGVAAQGDSDQTDSPPGITRPAQGDPGAQDGQGGQGRLSALAEALGVSEARLHAAIEKIRPSGGPGPGPGGRADASDMADALAKELGLSVDKLRSALDATGPARGGPQGGGGPGGAGVPGGAGPGSSGGSSGDDGSSGGSASGSLS